MTTLLIDGNNMGHRIFHTPQGSLEAKKIIDGEVQHVPSGVIFGVIKALKATIEKFPETTHVVVAWDGGRSDWRKAMYPDYKAQRDYGKDDAEKADRYKGLWKQMDILHDEVLKMLGIASIRIKGQEADDVIATACENLLGNKIIVTSDKDMLQLVSPTVSVYSPYRDMVISPSNFFEHTGVTQEAYRGYRAMIGDTSDNIQGIAGIGEKTAKGLMDKYGHIDNILNATGDDKKALMKSARTRKIFEKGNIDILARNNRIMSFLFTEHDKIKPVLDNAMDIYPDFNSKGFRQFCMDWQFADILAYFTQYSVVFGALGDE